MSNNGLLQQRGFDVSVIAFDLDGTLVDTLPDLHAATNLTLNDLGYDGPLTIEREIPEDPVQQKADIGKAVNLLKEVRATTLG